MPASSWMGLRATTICMVEQLGLATMPPWPSTASGLTSATTSGTSSCMRKWLVLSTTTAPAATSFGAHSALTEPPAEERTTSRPWIVSSLSTLHSTTEPFHSIGFPAERSEAKGTSSATGNPRSTSTSRIVVPTSPVAPSTPTLYPSPFKTASRVSGRGGGLLFLHVQVEGVVQGPYRIGHAIGGDNARDFDRRGGDHLDVDPLGAEHLEDPRGDARVGAHAGA